MTPQPPEPRLPGSQGKAKPKTAAATVLVLVSRIFRSFGRVLLLVAVARAFSVGEVASFAFYFALGSLLGLAGDAGLTEFVSREIAAAGFHHPRLERKALLLRSGTFVLSVAAALLVVLAWSGVSGLDTVGPLLSGSGFCLLDYISSTARANARYDLDLTYNVLFFLALLACLGVAHVFSLDYVHFQWTLGLALSMVLAGFVILRRHSLRFSECAASVLPTPDLFRQARWFLLRSIVSWCFSDLPVVLLRYLSTSLQVSLFSLTMRSVGFVTQVFVVIGFVFYPALANAHSVSRERFYEKSIALTLVNTHVMPAAFSACLAGGFALIALSGEAYSGAWVVVQILAFAYVLNQGGFSPLPLVAAGQEKRVSQLMLAALAAFGGGAPLLMPRFGAFGAAVALSAAFLVAKVGLLALYRSNSIPLGGRAFAVPFFSLPALLLLSLLLPLSMKMAMLVPLTLLSVALTIRTLRRVAIF